MHAAHPSRAEAGQGAHRALESHAGASVERVSADEERRHPFARQLHPPSHHPTVSTRAGAELAAAHARHPHSQRGAQCVWRQVYSVRSVYVLEAGLQREKSVDGSCRLAACVMCVSPMCALCLGGVCFWREAGVPQRSPR
eukprot:2649388-Rhodomonas_salina.2